MKRLTIIEGMKNKLDLGYFREVFHRSVKKRLAMGPRAFLAQLIRARGYSLLTPPQYEALVQATPEALTVDLRETRQFDRFHIPDAVSHPFEEFLGAVLTTGKYQDRISLPLVLVCDTGHMSRVAAGIIRKAGFNNLYSIDRGMRRMNRWYRIKQAYQNAENKPCPLCRVLLTV